MVVDAFQFEQDRPEHLCFRRRRTGGCILDSEAVGEVVADGAVTGDSFCEFDTAVRVATFEEPFDAFVDEPQAGLHVEDGFADDREAEVAGFDDAGVHWADGDLVDAGSFDGEERV